MLLDVARTRREHRCADRPRHVVRDPPELLEATAAAAGVELREGDILCLRTGWVGWYLGLDADGRARSAAASPRTSNCLPGLELPGAAMAEYLWDHGVAAVAADNPTVEAMPPPPSPTGDPALTDPNATLHTQVMGKLGMTLGEFFVFDELADDCAADGVYEFFFAAAPINVTGASARHPRR